MILGTGVGGGVVQAGQVHGGANGNAGEWGHSPLPWPRTNELPGRTCYCGAAGCIETFLSGPGLAADCPSLGAQSSGLAVADAAQHGDAAANAALERYADRLARAVACVVNVLDPDAIVLGGGLSNIECLYTSVPEKMAAYAFTDSLCTPLLAAKHGDSSGVRGAAWLWPVNDLITAKP